MLEIGDQIGNVSKGLSLKEITNVIKSCLYSKGRMKNEQERYEIIVIKSIIIFSIK